MFYSGMFVVLNMYQTGDDDRAKHILERKGVGPTTAPPKRLGQFNSQPNGYWLKSYMWAIQQRNKCP